MRIRGVKSEVVKQSIKTCSFALGQVVMTRGVNDMVAEDEDFAKAVLNSLRRHASGDCGDMCDEDRQANIDALANGDRIFSAYEKGIKEKIWIITEWDRSATTILFPDEY